MVASLTVLLEASTKCEIQSCE